MTQKMPPNIEANAHSLGSKEAPFEILDSHCQLLLTAQTSDQCSAFLLNPVSAQSPAGEQQQRFLFTADNMAAFSPVKKYGP